MAINVEERLAQLDSLNCFIENSREKFTSILSILGWDVDTLRQQVSYKNCFLYVCDSEVCSECITDAKRQNPALVDEIRKANLRWYWSVKWTEYEKKYINPTAGIVSTFLVDNLKEHTLCH
jgi:hypothetical protein